MTLKLKQLIGAFKMTRKISVVIALLSTLIAGCAAESVYYSDKLTQLDKNWLVTPEEAYQWSKVKDANLPTLTGSKEWRNYMEFLQSNLNELGVVDGFRNSWEFERWYTSNDSVNWSLHSNGDEVRVAHYGAYSGSTDSAGITAEMIYYDHNDPPESIEGKIVVIHTKPHPREPYPEDYLINYTFNDFEHATNSDTFPDPFQFVA